MTRNSGKVHVVRVRKTGYVDKQGRARDYSSAYLRRTYRDGGKVKNETVANIVRAAGPRHRPDRRGPEGPAAGPRRAGGHHHRVAAARARRRRPRDGQEAGPARAARPAGPAPGPGPGADHLPGGQARLQAGHPDLVGRHARWAPTWAWRRPAPMTSTRRWTGWKAGRTRSRRAGPPPPGPGAEPGADGAVRPVQLVAGGTVLPAGRPRLLPGWQERHGCRSSTGCSPTRRPPGRGPGVPRQHRRPGRVHRHRHGGAGEVRPGQDGHGRRPRHDHQRPDRRAEPAGGRHSRGRTPTGGSPRCAPPPSRS